MDGYAIFPMNILFLVNSKSKKGWHTLQEHGMDGFDSLEII